MSIIEAVQTYIKTCTELESGVPVWIDFLGPNPVAYAITPVPGERIIERYINGGSEREYPFVFQLLNYTANDAARLDSIGFCEVFADWLEEQTELGNLPVLDAGKTAEKIEATTWGFLFEQGESSTGVYQIQCKLTYEQQP